MPVGLYDAAPADGDVGGVAGKALWAERRPGAFHDENGDALGFYRSSYLSGTIAAGLAADSEIIQFRWTGADYAGLIWRVRLEGLSGTATAFAAGLGKVDMLAARAWTADGSGGSAQTLTGSNQKMRTSHPAAASARATLRGATTGALTAGTKTLDANPCGLCPLAFGTVASVQYVTGFDIFAVGETGHPLVLANEEGFVLRATVPGTGTWQFGVTVEWSAAYRY